MNGNLEELMETRRSPQQERTRGRVSLGQGGLGEDERRMDVASTRKKQTFRTYGKNRYF